MNPLVWMKVDGKPMSAVQAGWGEPVITNRQPYGCWEVTWSVPVLRQTRRTSLMAGKSVVVYAGPAPIWSGRMTEPNWDTGEMVAEGWVRQSEQTICLDSTGKTSSNPDVVIAQAIARGALKWVQRSSFSSVDFVPGSTTDNLNYVKALLDAVTSTASLYWGVNARQELYTAPSNPAPMWKAAPDSGQMGTTDRALVGTLYGRYLLADGTLQTAVVPNPDLNGPEVGIDLTKLGTMDLSKATSILNSILSKGRARTGWTNGIELTSSQISSLGGSQLRSGAMVVAGQGLRLEGLRDPRGLGSRTDIVLAETIWDVAQDTIQCNPVGLEARDLGSIIEDEGGEMLAFSS